MRARGAHPSSSWHSLVARLRRLQNRTANRKRLLAAGYGPMEICLARHAADNALRVLLHEETQTSFDTPDRRPVVVRINVKQRRAQEETEKMARWIRRKLSQARQCDKSSGTSQHAAPPLSPAASAHGCSSLQTSTNTTPHRTRHFAELVGTPTPLTWPDLQSSQESGS